MIKALRHLGWGAVNAAMDLVVPRQCAVCGVFVQNAGLCTTCWPNAHFIAAPLCEWCGLPFDYDVGADAWCGVCVAQSLPFGRARAAMTYDDVSRALILAFKHGDRLDLAPIMASWMRHAGSDLIGDAHGLVPVPLHPRRLRRRRYNQAAVLANTLGATCAIEVHSNALRRTRHTASQNGLGRKGRERNVRGFIAPTSAVGPQLEGRRLLLIDDVLTTGATVSACTRALLRAGAAQVDVLTLARVI